MQKSGCKYFLWWLFHHWLWHYEPSGCQPTKISKGFQEKSRIN